MSLKACKTPDEKAILQRLSKGEEDAFGILFNKYEKKVYAFAFRLLKSKEAAREIVQHVFLKIWMHKEKQAQIERFEAYLYRITRNLTLDHLRKIASDKACRNQLWKQVTVLSNRTEEDIIHKDYLHLLEEAVHLLPPQQQLVFSLSRNNGMTHDEIARQLHISKNTVKNHLAQALKSIRSYLSLHTDMVITVLLIMCSGSVFFYFH